MCALFLVQDLVESVAFYQVFLSIMDAVLGSFLAQSLSSMNLSIIGTDSARNDGAVTIPSGSKFAYITLFNGANIGYILVSTTTTNKYYASHSSSSNIKSVILEITANEKTGYTSTAVESDGFCCVFLG